MFPAFSNFKVLTKSTHKGLSITLRNVQAQIEEKLRITRLSSIYVIFIKEERKVKKFR